MVVKEDELELGLLHEEHLRVERGSGWFGEEEGAILCRKVISQSLVPVGVTSRD
jgi:hypothetical protein